MKIGTTPFCNHGVETIDSKTREEGYFIHGTMEMLEQKGIFKFHENVQIGRGCSC